MSGTSGTRRRRLPRRAEYTLLQNDSSDGSTISSTCSQRNAAPILCDKCWDQTARKRASKRCLDCKKNLCTVCAKCDEVNRPWWLPSLVVTCWRFLFTSTFTPHSIVDINHVTNDLPSWVHSQEACHVQKIPRIPSKSSLTSENRKLLSHKNDNTSTQEPRPKSDSVKTKRRSGEFNEHIKSNDDFDYVQRATSFENKSTRQKHRAHHRRTRSVDRRPYKDDAGRESRYKENWENDNFDAKFNVSDENLNRHRKGNGVTNKAFNHKLIGKDVDIDLQAANIGVKVKTEDTDTKDERRNSKKRKSSKKVKAPTPYTEQLFNDNPIWFKKSKTNHSRENVSKGNKNKGQPDNNTCEKHYPERRFSDYGETFYNNTNEECFADSNNLQKGKSNDELNYRKQKEEIKTTSRYFVEEPADLCPICLEDLPGNEARTLACAHSLHTRCLIGLLQGMEFDFGIRCPVCSRVTTIQNYYLPKERWYMELPVSEDVPCKYETQI